MLHFACCVSHAKFDGIESRDDLCQMLMPMESQSPINVLVACMVESRSGVHAVVLCLLAFLT